MSDPARGHMHRARPGAATECPGGGDVMSTTVIVLIVVVLALVGIGIVADELIRLRKWLNKAPEPEVHEPPDATP